MNNSKNNISNINISISNSSISNSNISNKIDNTQYHHIDRAYNII